MASFFEDLWLSVLTPGPTTSLVIATNASFACLQLLLLCLLIATYSVHYVVLSFLCAGLWWSINWFVVELQSAKESNSVGESEKEGDMPKGPTIPAGDSDTETEPSPESMKPPPLRKPSTKLKPEGPEAEPALRKRRSMGDSSGYISTDSEWEKISESSEKDR